MKFEAMQIHFISEVFGLLSFKNFATTAMWHNDFSSLLYHDWRINKGKEE